MSWLLYPLLLALQLAFLFVILTYFGGMWKGAQDQGGHGWVASLLWAIGLLVILNYLHYAHDTRGVPLSSLGDLPRPPLTAHSA
jgi:hypothetical protein